MTKQADYPIRLMPQHQPAAARMLTHAFYNDPLYAKLIPDKPERIESLGWLWKAILHTSLLFGEVYTTPQVRGAACWLAPGQTDLNLWQLLRSGFALPRVVMRYRAETRKRMMQVVMEMERTRHELMPGKHWYLWLLGVEPAFQGQGIGGKLLQPTLERADALGVPCYLETETERNVTFYRQHGFAVAREMMLDWLDQKIWLLRREPRR